MKLDLLLTPELKATMPDTIKVINNFGQITVKFEPHDPKEKPNYLTGDNAIVDGKKSEIINWLKPFDGIAIGCGAPALEKFTIMHIKEE